MNRRFAVVGGGITGLAAAWELRRTDPDADVVVHEPGRVGGKLLTTPFAGRMVDEGADAFLARVPWGRQLCDELGLGEQLVTPATGAAYVASAGRLHPLPAGTVLGVPVESGPLREGRLVSADAADRVETEPSLPGEPLAPDDDPSVGDLVRRRFGDEILERLVDPLLGGINAGDSDRLSVRAAAPQLAEAAERSASLVDGLRLRPAETIADPSAPVFWSLPGGMGVLVDSLVAALAAAGVAFSAEAVHAIGDLDADRVVVATPAPVAARLARGVGAATAADLLAAIGHSSPVLVTLALRAADVRHPLDASGFLVARGEKRLLTACSFATTKWAHLSGGDTVVLRASAGRYGDDRAIDTDDDDLVAALLAELDDLLGLAGDPVEVRVSRWRDGFPQYEPGHLARVAAIEADVTGAAPAVAVAGAAYRGIGVPACIRQGREAAARLAAAGVRR